MDLHRQLVIVGSQLQQLLRVILTCYGFAQLTSADSRGCVYMGTLATNECLCKHFGNGRHLHKNAAKRFLNQLQKMQTFPKME